MLARLLAVLVAGLTAIVAVVSPAFASLGDEVSAGHGVATQLQTGNASCAALSDTQFEHLGEYVMERMVGSQSAHEAMNQHMTQAIGAENADRMHQLLGRRFAACAGGAAADVPMGPGMMGGSGNGDWRMMNGSVWGWMHNGSWQHMSQSRWRQLASTMMGARYTAGHHGWSSLAVLAAVLAAVLLGALVAVLLVRRSWHRRPPASPSAA